MPTHRSLFISVLVSFAWPTAALAQSSQAQTAFRLCDAEGFMALNIGRAYFLAGRRKESVLPYVAGDSFGEGLVSELSRRADAGELKHYADFATDKLYECANREHLQIEEPREKARICFARVDIPFFLHTDRQAGVTKEDSIQKLSRALNDPGVFPTQLISAVAEQVFTLQEPPPIRKLMGTVFWSCLYNEQWSGK